MARKTSDDLFKIGPGLGRRSKIWTVVKKRSNMKFKHGEQLNENEATKLNILADNSNWMDMVPKEWQIIYGELYDTSISRASIATRTRDQIIRDVPRTFSLYIEHHRYLRLHFPSDMTAYCEALQEVLEVACHQDYSCGYCQGMNFLAATFLLSEGNKRSAFILFSYLVKQCHLEILYNPKCSSLLEYMEYFERRLEQHNPAVYNHLLQHEFPPLCYTVEWFTTCFLVSSPGELSACVIDLILVGFNDMMIRVGLALMDNIQSFILQSTAEKLQLNFKKMLLLANCVEVMSLALMIPSEDLEDLSRLETMKRNCEAMGPGEEWVDTMRLPSLRRMQATTAKADPTTSADGTTISTGVGVQVLDCTTNTAAAELSMADITDESMYTHAHHHHHHHTHMHGPAYAHPTSLLAADHIPGAPLAVTNTMSTTPHTATTTVPGAATATTATAAGSVRHRAPGPDTPIKPLLHALEDSTGSSTHLSRSVPASAQNSPHTTQSGEKEEDSGSTHLERHLMEDYVAQTLALTLRDDQEDSCTDSLGVPPPVSTTITDAGIVQTGISSAKTKQTKKSALGSAAAAVSKMFSSSSRTTAPPTNYARTTTVVATTVPASGVGSPRTAESTRARTGSGTQTTAESTRARTGSGTQPGQQRQRSNTSSSRSSKKNSSSSSSSSPRTPPKRVVVVHGIRMV